MITSIENPMIDYLEISLGDKGGAMSSSTFKPDSELIREAIFLVFDMSFADRISDSGAFTYFERKGVSYTIYKGFTKVTMKGFFWLQKKAFLKVKMLLHYLHLHKIKTKLLRLDVRRNFFAGSTQEPFSDIKKGFWINKASAESTYSPEMYSRGKAESVATYFKSSQFTINSYDKTNQMKTFEKRISRLKKEDKKERLLVAMKRHKELYGEKKVFRFEVKLTSPDLADNFQENLLAKSDEESFCYSVLSAFYSSYPMKKEKAESKRFRQFFFMNKNKNKNSRFKNKKQGQV